MIDGNGAECFCFSDRDVRNTWLYQVRQWIDGRNEGF